MTPGRIYVIASYSLEAGTSFNNGQGGIGTIDPLINFIQDQYNNSGRAEYPYQTDHLPGPWLGANFKFIALAVPEPATWVMLIGGFAMVGGTLRSRRRGQGLLATA
ncbi:MAG: PEPxxWA-CTERM sorting domain-containing protein [Sphingomonas sp.]|nr:PEPxxWA-CTERM sorting domain-containing protein [Sphingomonas sp.]